MIEPVDRSQLDAGEIEPDQEVTGYAPVVVEPTLRDPSLALTPKVVDEGKREAVENRPEGSAQGGGTWTLQALHALRFLSERHTLPGIAARLMPSENDPESR